MRQALIVMCATIILLTFSSFAVDSGPGGEFNVTPDSIWLNWTNNYRANITIGAKTNLSVVIDNTTFIVGNYSQREFYLNFSEYEGKYWEYNSYNYCFFQSINTTRYDNPLLVQNSSGVYTNETGLMLNGTQKNMTLIHYVVCPPGRYFGIVSLYNSTNSSEQANITVTIDVPISTANEWNATTGVGMFKGKLPSNEYMHSYFFNTSNITNATGIFVNLSWSSGDLDLFLLGSGLKASSRERGNYERLWYNYLPKDQMWEIRICGNLTTAQDYTGYVHFTTLNATNSSGRVDLIDFGDVNVSENKSFSLTLKNEGALKPTVSQSIELWHSEKRNGSSAANFTFLVPAAANKVKAILEWEGDTNYSIFLYYPNGSLANSSINKHIPAKLCGVKKQEWTEAGVQEGFWRVEVRNYSASNPYNLTFIFYVSAGNWISTNFTQMTFNSSGLPNSSQSFVVNLTASKGLSGLYEGRLLYSGSMFEVPLRFNLTAGTLLVNNTLKEGVVTVTDNIGFNRTGDDLSIEITLNNTGNKAINLAYLNSPSLKYGSYYANFTYSKPSSLAPGESKTLKINITINTSHTQNKAGLYTGWIYIDGNASPYDGFNLTIRLNLTDDLRVDVIELKTADGDQLIENVSKSENVTVKVKVYYINGSQIIFNQSVAVGLNAGDSYLINLLNEDYKISTDVIPYLHKPFNITFNFSSPRAEFRLKCYRYVPATVQQYNRMGTIKYEAENAYYIDQDYIYEGGAVILSQHTGDTMLYPPFFFASNATKTVNITLINVIGIGGKTGAAGYGTYSIRTNFSKWNSYEYWGSNFIINITTKYPSAWKKFLEDEMEESGLTYTIEEGNEYVKVQIQTKVILTLNIADICAQIGPGWVV